MDGCVSYPNYDVRRCPTRLLPEAWYGRTAAHSHYYGGRTIGNRTRDIHKNLYNTLFLRSVFGPDYYVPP